MIRSSTIGVFAMSALVAMASPALAHPKLASASPAVNSTGASPKHIVLNFNEKLIANFSSADLVMTGMPGMKAHAPMKMAATSMVYGADGKSLMVMPAKPLSAGTYRVAYRVVAGDSHRITGGYAFQVK